MHKCVEQLDNFTVPYKIIPNLIAVKLSHIQFAFTLIVYNKYVLITSPTGKTPIASSVLLMLTAPKFDHSSIYVCLFEPR